MLIGLTSKAEFNQVDDKFNYKAHVGKQQKKEQITQPWYGFLQWTTKYLPAIL